MLVKNRCRSSTSALKTECRTGQQDRDQFFRALSTLLAFLQCFDRFSPNFHHFYAVKLLNFEVEVVSRQQSLKFATYEAERSPFLLKTFHGLDLHNC